MAETGILSLAELIAALPLEWSTKGDLSAVPVSGVEYDSREVKPGDIFIAIPGMQTDGHQYISQAVSKGAIAVVGSRQVEDCVVPYIQVADPRQALGYLASGFYGHPAHSLVMIGVTGTDGKTTTTNLIYQILLSAGIAAGVVSTVNAMIGQEVYDTGFHVTTPQATEIQHLLAKMKSAGLTHVVLEATSHGLAQYRVTGCEFDMGVLTNITHEHLNDHGSFAAYRDAKTSLFSGLANRPMKPGAPEPLAVLNQDDLLYEYVRDLTSVRKVSYGLSQKADVWADEIRPTVDGLYFNAHIPGVKEATPIHCQIPGIFNVSNCLAAISATAVGLKIDPQAVREGIHNLHGIPGRMERIDVGQPFSAIVDFAHTPNALVQALTFARKITSGRVIAVFGSAGLRDREKRRMMAETSIQLADFTVLTAEDPRTELLSGILDEMRQGGVSKGGVEGQTFVCVPDRGEAIRFAVRNARPGDLVITCGKGHEQSMCFGEVEYLWDDRTAMRAALAELTGIEGPPMPYLPTQDHWD